MKVKTKENEIVEKKINDLETNHLFTIPENIKQKILERGFFLYNWIGEKDVKESLERDFLKSIDKFGIIIAILMLIPGFIAYNSGSIISFFILLLVLNLIFLSYLIFLSIKRSSLLRKNAYVVLTNNYISINGNIKELDNFNKKDIEQINEISNIFEEKIFEESKIKNSKSSLTKKIGEKFSSGFLNILKLGKGNSKNSGQLVMVLIVLYLIYAVSLLSIYIIGIFLVWVFGIFLNLINKNILLIKGHKITKINSNFENIDLYSNYLLEEKNQLEKLLNEAKDNNWIDSLLKKINSKIELINKNASKAININIELKKEIESSSYKEMFDYITYNFWIKKQISSPLEQIKNLLEKNLGVLKNQKKDIEKLIENETDSRKSGPLLASKTRIEMRIKEIRIHIEKMILYINKLN